jgi:hypothetical protein
MSVEATVLDVHYPNPLSDSGILVDGEEIPDTSQTLDDEAGFYDAAAPTADGRWDREIARPSR